MDGSEDGGWTALDSEPVLVFYPKTFGRSSASEGLVVPA